MGEEPLTFKIGAKQKYIIQGKTAFNRNNRRTP